MEQQGERPVSDAAAARLEMRVTGRVQGVGFRAFTQEAATALGCSGYVRNSPDRSAVDVVAEGPRSALEQLLAALERGPRLAHVSSVTARCMAATGEFRDFDSRY